MRKAVQLGLLLAMSIYPLYGAEIANLRNGYSIRHERHEVLGDVTRLYTGEDTAHGYIDVPSVEVESYELAPVEAKAAVIAKTADVDEIIREVSLRSQVDADFIAAVIHAESAGNPRAVSRKGAQGLMQLMPGTADKLGVKDSFDAADNVDGGVRYLLELLARFHYDVAKALAAYNAGPGRVEQYKGVPPYRETRAYVTRIINDYNHKKLAERRQSQMAKAQPTSAGGRQ